MVEVTDETGRPAAGAAVSFHLPDEGPGGIFTNGLRTEVVTADPTGRAVLRGLQVNRVPGRFQIRILASKEQARAGTVSFQYVADPRGGPAPAAVAPSAPGVAQAPPATARANRKWWILAAVAGAAAAGGMAARGGNGASGGPPAAIAPPAMTTPPHPPIVIGTPTITVVRP